MREAIVVEEDGMDGYAVEACLEDSCHTFKNLGEAEEWLSEEGCKRVGSQEIILPHVTRIIYIYRCPD